MSVLSPELSLTTAEAAAAEAPPLRLLPAPCSAPPYDDELPQRPVARTPPLGPLRFLPVPLRLVPPAPAAVDDDDELALTPVSALPPARPVAQALVQGLLEVMAGVRPVSQLQRGTTPELFASLEQLVHGRPRATGRRPITGAVRSVHVQQRPEGVAEVCATVVRDGRAAAIALRLEGVGGRWCCTELVGL